MDLFEAIKTRQSVRAYQNKEVEDAKLQTLLAAVDQAPSAGNLQAYQIYLVRDLKLKQALAKAALDQQSLTQAPLVLVFCADQIRASVRYRDRGEQLYSVQDATVAVAYAQLAATALGLATCWIGAFDEGQIAKIMELPRGERPVAMLPIGYAAETPARTPRRVLTEIVIEKKG